MRQLALVRHYLVPNTHVALSIFKQASGRDANIYCLIVNIADKEARSTALPGNMSSWLDQELSAIARIPANCNFSFKFTTQ